MNEMKTKHTGARNKNLSKRVPLTPTALTAIGYHKQSVYQPNPMSETRIVDDAALKQAVNEILSNVDPEQATFRQIRDKLNNEHNINTDGKKEVILSFIEAFFSGEGEGEGEEEEKEAEEDEQAEDEGTSSSNGATASKQGENPQ
jgi:hypothetical protein